MLLADLAGAIVITVEPASDGAGSTVRARAGLYPGIRTVLTCWIGSDEAAGTFPAAMAIDAVPAEPAMAR